MNDMFKVECTMYMELEVEETRRKRTSLLDCRVCLVAVKSKF